jgi:hypothetical protein
LTAQIKELASAATLNYVSDIDKLLTAHEYDALGEDFEKKKRRTVRRRNIFQGRGSGHLFGEEAGTFDLAQFTPKLKSARRELLRISPGTLGIMLCSERCR